jgi:hypothetical protein
MYAKIFKPKITKEYKMSIMKQADELEKFILDKSINPKEDFPGLVNEGLSVDVIECWKQTYQKE